MFLVREKDKTWRKRVLDMPSWGHNFIAQHWAMPHSHWCLQLLPATHVIKFPTPTPLLSWSSTLHHISSLVYLTTLCQLLKLYNTDWVDGCEWRSGKYPRICMERLKKTMKNLNQDSRLSANNRTQDLLNTQQKHQPIKPLLLVYVFVHAHSWGFYYCLFHSLHDSAL
jgi:hypothetical protein